MVLVGGCCLPRGAAGSAHCLIANKWNRSRLSWCTACAKTSGMLLLLTGLEPDRHAAAKLTVSGPVAI